MKYLELRPISEAEYKRGKDHEREKAIKWDKQKIEEALKSNDTEKCVQFIWKLTANTERMSPIGIKECLAILMTLVLTILRSRQLF